MKRIFNSFLGALVVSLLLLSSCDKEPELPYPGFDSMEYTDDFYIYNLSWEDPNLTVIADSEPGEFSNKLTITEVRGVPQKVDLILYFFKVETGKWMGPYDVQTNLTFPYEMAFNAQMLVDAIPEYASIDDFRANDRYEFGLRITSAEGETFQTISVINNVLRDMLHVNIRNYPGASFRLGLRTIAICPTPFEDFPGNWTCFEYSDRFSEEDEFPMVVELAEDGETLLISGAAYWLGLTGAFELSFERTVPVGPFFLNWLPVINETFIGTTAHPYDIRIGPNSDYAGQELFDACAWEITIGYEVRAYTAGTNTLLGYFDWGVWTIKKDGEGTISMTPSGSSNRSMELRPSKN